MESVKEFFNIWRQQASFARYDRWCKDHSEELLEEYFAQKNDMDPIYWCWACKYSECDEH
jgi:hypothetical protein